MLLVVLSALIAFWGSYDAVRIAARVRAAEGRSRRLWLIAAGLSLGIGIWGMHFVAMLALRLPVPILYVPSLVLLSLCIAVAGAAAAFGAHFRPTTLPFHDLWLAVSTGVAISGMHYTAMAGMRLPAEMRYTPTLVVLSIGTSIVFPVLGIRPLRGPNATVHRPGLWPAMLTATGIVGMHFTAMAAVHFVPQVSLAMPARSLLVASPQLAIIVFIGAAAMITMAELAVAISRQEDAQRAQLRALTSRIDAAREAERSHIAREIHDELGQALTVLKLDLERVRSTSSQPSSATIDAMQARLADTVTALGRLAAGLRPPLLDESGLADGVRALADDVQQRTGLRVRVQIALAEGESGALDKDLATALYRMLQEALTNIVRHADATAVEVTLRATPHRLQLEVADNGRGITQRELDDARSLGLLGMRERARTWSGEVVITGAAGRGTRVIVTIPLRVGAL